MRKARIGGLMTAAVMAATGGTLAAPAAAQADDGTAYFAFTTVGSQNGRSPEFVFKLTDKERIAQARDIISGKESQRVHVHGRILKRTTIYNPRFSYHLDPDTINFFDMAIEVCDASVEYTEDHLDEAGGAFLPGGHFCPWSSKVTREIQSD
ncbi:BP74-related protein [Catenuloplanes japonicus]|uniref:BP74-related protein n=1 Tax=Catenuloplanes japonicus TaxID=33876 RepID=UPI000527354B|nr:hypothetical protein [Catenuloplanes japonicus]